jgi:predicted DNA-binding protein (UPF0251 family)
VRFRLDPALVEAVLLTAKQREALEFYDGVNYGYEFVARQLGISRESARNRVRGGLRKLELVLREPVAAAPKPRKRQPAGIHPFDAVARRSALPECRSGRRDKASSGALSRIAGKRERRLLPNEDVPLSPNGRRGERRDWFRKIGAV